MHMEMPRHPSPSWTPHIDSQIQAMGLVGFGQREFSSPSQHHQFHQLVRRRLSQGPNMSIGDLFDDDEESEDDDFVMSSRKKDKKPVTVL